MARLFLSYRRSDSGAYAGRVAECLRSFQFESVYLDREDIKLGDNFADSIRAELSKCDAVLVLMGKTWAEVRDDAGQRRLDDPSDWVRREVVLALSMGLPVFAVLFDGAQIPSAKQLPSELAPLVTNQCYEVNGNYFNRDLDDLGRRIETLLVAKARAMSPSQGKSTANSFLLQLRVIWLALGGITGAVAITPSFLPAVPQFFWLFPGSMSLASFLWWLYWMGESQRTARMRMA